MRQARLALTGTRCTCRQGPRLLSITLACVTTCRSVATNGGALNTYEKAAARTRCWLDENFAADGSSRLEANDPRFYYKAPYALVMAGLRAKGGRVAKYVLDHFVDDNGGLSGSPAFSLEERIYAMGWLAFGAV